MIEFAKRFRLLLSALFFLLLALLFFTLQLRGEPEPSRAARAVMQVSYPLQEKSRGLFAWLRGQGERLRFLLWAEEENRRLRGEISSLRREVNRLQEALLAAQRLGRLSSLQERHPAAVAANVFARDPSSWFKTVLVDKGERDGIARDTAVAAAEGVVGRVIEVFPNTAKVLLITDPNSSVDAIVQRTRTQGILEGRLEEFCNLKYVRKGDDVQIGDRIVTSGLGGIFPKGLVLGTVTKVERRRPGIFQTVEVAPGADLSRLEEVLILSEEP
jgi:rod shape-determining protein MreC